MALADVSSQPMALPRRARREPTRLHTPHFIAWLPLASVLIGIASLFYLTQTSEVATTGYSIQELQVEESNWKLRNEQLSLELAKARSLAAVEAEATKRLLMVPAKDVVYLQPQPVDASRRPAPASRGDARVVPALEKATVAPGKGLMDALRDTISGVLAPRSLRKP
ncbi:MAG: hypothetical protein M1380_06885 [Chloroflexi bacterium]|nr:hypothetical protein [Chloroflexota bacterium]